MALGICVIWDIFSYSEWELAKETASLLLQAPCSPSSTVALMVSAWQIWSSSRLFSVQHFYSSGQFLNCQLWCCNFLDIHYKRVCMREMEREEGIFLFWQHCYATPHQKNGKYMMFISHGCCKCPILCTMWKKKILIYIISITTFLLNSKVQTQALNRKISCRFCG